MSHLIPCEALTPDAFAPFGDVLQAKGPADRMINQGMCGRFHDRASLDFSDGRAGISLFDAVPRSLPYKLEMVERHPDGSQAFLPMTQNPFLVIVAPAEGDAPGKPRAFLAAPGQGINFFRGTWHGVLTPLAAPGLFAVFDRIGDGANLQEHWFETPFTVVEEI
ncbi:ureidoglycolate lyase [Meridianimarinicoccus aquatilis]|uniref:Ureidoglycolate lyase n=1 Tax=Meridianimarinicoccus aquatilis TaxID=2552766 RepID=A0A4R6ARK9_9RHOB|nr:ureidoglycolate lyase [Fluviibacterium aquatile]QIE43074.1 ureidoglycolate lyase [Rhodobacteraceae bacterium SC52]TDL84726.1 ureidoglycolate lyase [Fluviibacterium aquatile]